MGKYKQWLHHQEVGARLRDEIAAHEAEREQVLKLAPTRPASLPDLSNPIIASLLGQGLLSQAPAQPTATAANGASARVETTTEQVAEVTTIHIQQTTEQTPGKTEQQTVVVESKVAEQEVTAAGKNGAQAAKAEAQAVQEEVKVPKSSTGKHKAVSGVGAKQAEKPAEKPPEPQPVAPAAPPPTAQPETIDPLLEALLARAEQEPEDPLEALNALASKGPNLTKGEAPTTIRAFDNAPQATPVSTGESALNALMGKRGATSPTSEAHTAGAEMVATTETTVRAEATVRVEKGRADTDELVAARPAEGYTEPRLAVPWWLRSVELNQNSAEAESPPEMTEDDEGKQRLSVSLPFENEEDMRLHESVERWWQRWRQQG